MEPVTRNKFKTPIEREAVARDWPGRGYSCDLFVDPPGLSLANRPSQARS